MTLRPHPVLTETQVQSGLRYVTRDGLFTEAMVAFTSGTFLVAMALQMGASNFQIGLLSALPTLCNIFQLLSIWLVQRYNNRRAVSVICSFLARFPLLVIGVMPLMFSAGASLTALIFLLFFHYTFGSVAGASWNSWMKDLVPTEKLGTFFSYRARLVQTTNVVFSLLTAVAIDHVKTSYPQYEAAAYPLMFLLGGIMGMISVYMLARTPEPVSFLEPGHILKKIRKPLQDTNFRKLLFFNSFWSFSLNLATPFFSVFLLKNLHMGLSAIICLNILSQVSSILFVRIWGGYSDRFSNKTVIRICAPLYILCILGWTLAGHASLTFPLLILIHILSGITTAGINLSITNIGLKLAGKNDAIVYIAARNMLNAFIPALAPLLGGLLVDYIDWKYFFVISAVMAFCSLRFLKTLKEEGEVGKGVVVNAMMSAIRLKLQRREILEKRA